MPRRQLVLLVDDNASFRDRVERELRAEGYDTLAAASGSSALDIARDILPAAVVTDLEMPGLDGLGLCRTLRELRAFDAVPLILCTAAAADDERVVAAGEVPGVTVTHKPIDGTDLADLLDELLGIPARSLQGMPQPLPATPSSPSTPPDHASGLWARLSARKA